MAVFRFKIADLRFWILDFGFALIHYTKNLLPAA
jgi:hypothetical protein